MVGIFSVTGAVASAHFAGVTEGEKCLRSVLELPDSLLAKEAALVITQVAPHATAYREHQILLLGRPVNDDLSPPITSLVGENHVGFTYYDEGKSSAIQCWPGSTMVVQTSSGERIDLQNPNFSFLVNVDQPNRTHESSTSSSNLINSTQLVDGDTDASWPPKLT